ncbi:hypothetical protein [Methylobacterium flocculans]|uniref:hypothetical protein n=1 Tax=Methylobacterium flocculans TaxID=2984843 RepID=UPI0021F26308|nr:hypothetical protein [Methylobacterium sp. FF17]
MSAALAPAIQAPDAVDRLPELSRLAADLATNVINAQIEGQPVPDGHIRSLLDAALLLREYGVALPTLLGQIMAGVAEPEVRSPIGESGSVEAVPVESLPAKSGPEGSGPAEPHRRAPRAEDDDDAGRLAWLLRPFQEAKG